MYTLKLYSAVCFFVLSSLIIPGNLKIHSHPSVKGKGILLVYTADMTTPFGGGMTMGIHIQIDTTIGFRYQAVTERGQQVVSNIAYFHKFSKPNQMISYNYLTKTSEVYKDKGKRTTTPPEVAVIGTEKVDKYVCTHLQVVKSGVDANGKKDFTQTDFWMSKELPGFKELTDKLSAVDKSFVMMGINYTIFGWGGLVKMTTKGEYSKIGKLNFDWRLSEVNNEMNFPASDFEVPSK